MPFIRDHCEYINSSIVFHNIRADKHGSQFP